jgi:pimeloyl-ACP methyl ester carboxylesterase
MKLEYKNITVNFLDAGKGNTIVFLHGFLENSSMWDIFIEEFSRTNRVVAIDLLGHGQTAPLGYLHTMEDNADLVYHVLSELRVSKATLIGHSMGGYVAMAFAELYPDMVKAVALVNSTARADNGDRKCNRDRAILTVKKDYISFVRLAVGNLFSERNRERLNPEIEIVKQEALKTPLQGIIASLEGMKIRKDREGMLHTAPYPILLALGKEDPVLNYEENCTQIENTQVELVTFPDGHISPVENQQQLLGVLRDFINP